MPEGDTVLRTARRLDQALTGAVVLHADLRWPGLSEVDLAGRTVLGTVAYGKHLLTRFGPEPDGGGSRIPTAPPGPLTLHSHLKMEGRWAIEPPGRSVPSGGVRVRAVIATAEWTAVATWLGQLDLVPTEREHELIGHLGPDIMVDDFLPGGLADAVARILARPDREIGAALLDQTNVAGIGTMYMAESLFLQKVSPWTPTAELGADGVAAALERARRLLLNGATSATPTTTGDQRRGHEVWVHARSGRTCHRCGTVVRVATIGDPTRERTAFWCPSCQPGPTPTDNGRPQAPLGSSPRRSATGYRRRR
ncbi:Fpg/Nei family DNA glycosylase [Nakamurella sp. YIM 132087]|uniref:DNA-(apurinic or apyrimidinic site) lyase n=1 Tax=Nakamurella alba TaxID=2665158 RepID=A0A7K1FML2_9ACTN|nr:DNA-formamidopyrimidine glycosylase family protein [Nakamurella alba]MTD14559.1 Fpg/Nei family DNA glycosylase [Nakamurella alba]